MSWLNTIRHALPTGRAFRMMVDSTLRRFFTAVATVPQAIESEQDNIWDDLDPQRTRKLTEYEQQFGLSRGTLDTQQRRDRLQGAWGARGGQSRYYLQQQLQQAGFDVWVHPWYVEPVEARDIFACEAGEAVAEAGEVNAQAGLVVGQLPVPQVRDPGVYLRSDGSNQAFTLSLGAQGAFLGGDVATMGRTVDRPGYLLVNKPGGPYNIPTDPLTWPHFTYVAGEHFPNLASVPAARRDEFEALCLKFMPAHNWIGVLVRYQ